jgi:hypothetical protein
LRGVRDRQLLFQPLGLERVVGPESSNVTSKTLDLAARIVEEFLDFVVIRMVLRSQGTKFGELGENRRCLVLIAQQLRMSVDGRA